MNGDLKQQSPHVPHTPRRAVVGASGRVYDMGPEEADGLELLYRRGERLKLHFGSMGAVLYTIMALVDVGRPPSPARVELVAVLGLAARLMNEAGIEP